MKIDSIKEKLSEFRFYRGLTVASITGIFGSLLLKELSGFLVVCGAVALIFLVMFWIGFSVAINEKIEELEKL